MVYTSGQEQKHTMRV